MRRNLPKISTLQVFDAVAQHLNMTFAGESMHLTQGAVSKQIKGLEEQLGRQLFYRQQGELALTPVGEQFAEQVRIILDKLQHVVDQVAVDHYSDNVISLKVVTEPTFAMRWLVPKLTEFNAIYPQIGVDLNTDFLTIERNLRKCDLAILYGDGNWNDCICEFLRPESLVAVATPNLLYKKGKAISMEDVLSFPFMHHNHPISSTGQWLKAAGKTQKEISSLQGGQFEHFTLLVEAVKCGLGASVVPKYLIEGDLREGNLVKICDAELKIDGAYYLVYNEDMKDNYSIRQFRKWLLTHKEY